jgi:hypothetical protein
LASKMPVNGGLINASMRLVRFFWIDLWTRYVAGTAEMSYSHPGSKLCTFAINADERHCSPDTGRKTFPIQDIR